MIPSKVNDEIGAELLPVMTGRDVRGIQLNDKQYVSTFTSRPPSYRLDTYMLQEFSDGLVKNCYLSWLEEVVGCIT